MGIDYETLREKYGDTDAQQLIPEKQPSPSDEDATEELIDEEPADEQSADDEPADEEHADEDVITEARNDARSDEFLALGKSIALLDEKITALYDDFSKARKDETAVSASAPLLKRLDELERAMQKQEKANTDILRDSKNFQAMIREQLQDELSQYRKMHMKTANAPILTDIANLYIMSCKAISFIAGEKERSCVSGIVLDGFQELLEEQGVIIHSTPAGEKRSLKTCKTRRTIPTGNSELHGKVAESLSPSFTLENQVLIKESIDTYVFDETLADADSSANEQEVSSAREAETTQTDAAENMSGDTPAAD